MQRRKRLRTSKTGIVFPTCNPEIVFDRLLPSIDNILELAPIATWLLYFNGDKWDFKLITEVINCLGDKGFSFIWKYKKEISKPVKCLKIREQCAELDPYLDLYLFIDDDFKFMPNSPRYPFSSGRRYLHSIDYMTRFPKCGLVNTKSFLGGTTQKLKIIPTKDDMHATNQGLLLRNMRKHHFLLAFPELREYRGGLEEQTMSYCRIEEGYFAAKQMNNPTIHVTGKLSDWDDDKENFHNVELIDKNLAGWIRDRYHGEWDYQKKRLPPSLWNMYKVNGGIELTDSLIINYADFEPHWDEDSVGLPRRAKRLHEIL